jgi:flagellar protein FlaG
MDIAPLKSPQAQQDVGLKVVKDNNSQSSTPTESSEAVIDRISQQQEAVAAQKDSVKQTIAQMNDKLTQQVSKMNEYVQSIQRDLNFSVDDSSGEVVVKVFNRHTNELIRQFPTEEALRLAERMKENGDSNSGSGLILKVEV